MKKLLFITLFIIANLAYANEALYCRVNRVFDGNTIGCLTDDKIQLKLKLYQITAPRGSHPLAKQATQATQALVWLALGKDIFITTQGKDRHDNLLATLYSLSYGYCIGEGENALCTTSVNFDDINIKMIEQGIAWYTPSTEKNEEYMRAEGLAQYNKVGLWQDKNK